MQLKIHIFYFMMPIAAVIYHLELVRICKKAEYKVFLVLKYLLFVVFYTILVYSFIREITLIANVNLFATSTLLTVYTYAIFNNKMFQRQDPNIQPGGANAVRAVESVVPTENVFRQHMQNNNAQVAFD